MIMDQGEIERSYRAAKNKNMQIGVLAELNDVKREKMREYLEGIGCDVPHKVGGKVRKWDVRDAMDLYCSELSDSRISKKLGTTTEAIRAWRQRGGLVANRKARTRGQERD